MPAELDRTQSDFADEEPIYRCSCGGFKTKYFDRISVCPACGAPIEEDE